MTASTPELLALLENLSLQLRAHGDELAAVRGELARLRDSEADNPKIGPPLILPGQTKATLEQLAHRYNVSPEFAHKHRLDWGQEPMGDGANSKVRYDIETADAWWSSRRRARAVPARRPELRSKRVAGGPAALRQTRHGATMAEVR